MTMRHTAGMGRHRRFLGVLVIAIALVSWAAPASAKTPKLRPATYPDMTTYQCRTEAIPIHPGQNINDFNITKTCPNAVKVSGPGDASIFSAGSTAEGYVTRFKPSMVELKPDGTSSPRASGTSTCPCRLAQNGVRPDLRLGEEKTIAMMPQGYGLKVGATDDWGLNQMIHSLNASAGRQVYITWEIDWVPETTPKRTDIANAEIQWLDVAGTPQVYPVFDAERGYDSDGDGKFTFPDEVPTDPSQPVRGARKISNEAFDGGPRGLNLVFAPAPPPGGTRVDLRVARDGSTRRDDATLRRRSSASSSPMPAIRTRGRAQLDVAMRRLRNWRSA